MAEHMRSYGARAALFASIADKKDQTLAWLEKAYEEREGSLVYLNVEQTFDPIRSDPRFKDLVHRIGLPE